MKIISIVGARPQFVKAAIVSYQFQKISECHELLIHTGQHYDANMSDIFFEQMGIPHPARHLRVGSASHGRQTGEMLEKIEAALLDECPDMLLVYGDTNSTIAGALAASKLHIPVAHVEAGLRSYNRRMPEEINRVAADHLSSLLLCPTKAAVENLRREGIVDQVHLVGDVMYDAAVHFANVAHNTCNPLRGIDVQAAGYALMTCHRAENTDDPFRLQSILDAAAKISTELPVLFPLHPRTRNRINRFHLSICGDVKVLEPASYFEMLFLEKNASLVLTDSGGVQKEAFFFGTPCVTLREETEWIETIEMNANLLAGADGSKILAMAKSQLERSEPIPSASRIYGDGEAAKQVVDLVCGMAEKGHARNAA